MATFSEQPQATPYDTIVLCGGNGTRMLDITGNEVPKHLLELGGKTVLDYAMQPFGGSRRLIFATSNHADKIMTYAGNAYGAERVIQSHQPEPLGVVSAVRQAIHDNGTCETFVLTHGDEVVPGLQIDPMIATHQACGRLATVLLTCSVPAEPDFAMTTSDDKAVLTLERDPGHMPETGGQYGIGTFVLAREVTAYMESAGSWTEMLRALITDGQLTGHVVDIPFFNVNTPKDLADISGYMLSRSISI